MESRRIANEQRFTVVTRRRTPLRAVRELWWGHDRRRRMARLGEGRRRHPLDEGYVVDAMARQLDEIRSLPEFAP